MSDSILVTYATRYGSTQEVAETIAATLREGGLVVDVKPANQVRLLAGYDAVVVGAPLYMFTWLKAARDFVARHRATLEEIPVAVELFGGKFDPARLTFPYNLIPALKQMPVSDIRDWDAIRAWAAGLTEKLT
jgi:menaquinone-dependent protoporphyrinogen oxidase